MKPEDITGIDSNGILIAIDGCTCDYNEVREGVRDRLRFAFSIRRIVSTRDPACPVHRLI